MVNDRLTRGIIAGIAGGLAQNIYGYIARFFGLTDLVYLDVARGVLFNYEYKGFLAVLVSAFGCLTIDSIWGVLFAFVMRKTSSKYHVVKGILFAVSIWFFVRVLGTKIFGVMVDTDPQTALVFFFGAVLFGTTMASVLKWLDMKFFIYPFD